MHTSSQTGQASFTNMATVKSYLGFFRAIDFYLFLIMKSSEEKPVVSRYKAIAVG